MAACTQGNGFSTTKQILTRSNGVNKSLLSLTKTTRCEFHYLKNRPVILKLLNKDSVGGSNSEFSHLTLKSNSKQFPNSTFP